MDDGQINETTCFSMFNQDASFMAVVNSAFIVGMSQETHVRDKGGTVYSRQKLQSLLTGPTSNGYVDYVDS